MSQATLGSTPYQNSSLFSGYYLDERVYDLDGWDCDEAAGEAFEDLQTLWDLERSVVETHNENELLDSWIDEVLDVLGFSTLSEETLPNGGGFTDRLLFESAEDRVDAIERREDGNTKGAFNLASAVLEAKTWNTDFTERFSETRSYRDASHQIKYYLEQTPENLQWGVLTDGRKWRLYGTKDYATEIYYEVDLPELLDSGTLEQFKYFYAFFRPEAFHETAGTSFLDTVWNESETAAQELGEDLQDNVFTALRVLGEGFIHQNDLDIDPDDEDARAELKEQSLVLLYRLMFVLYAESRGLIRPDKPADRDEYEEHFSLDQLRLEIHEDVQSGESFEDYSGYSTKMWSQLQNLFSLVDEGNDDLGIPPYNGGLFDDDEHEFLAEYEVADRHIAEVIHRLGTTVDEDDDYVLADYADLDTRHLGSIYEGLLEHEFRIADEQYAAVAEDGGQVWKPATEVSVADAVETVEEGELYVVNDDGERKATGAYYTPDYVVSYIVEETIDPLLDDVKSDLEADGLEPSEPEYFRRFWQRVQDLKVLDPAMGSAHFLTSATGYLTEQVMEVVREQEIQGYDEQHLRREIAKECIYGVDINGMAVELGKLSMWLETLAADQPLAFLDHHLKDGNSLVGSDITDVLSDDTDEEDGQLTLMQAAARARKNTLEHVMDLMQELLAIDNETLDDIKSMEELYDEIRDDPLYQRLFEIANVHTAEEFGLDVPEGVYNEMAGAIEDEDEWAEIQSEDWFESAQVMADEEDFFHWELEYPEVFFGEDGEKREDEGFDAVVGNPPYLAGREWTDELRGHRDYFETNYSCMDDQYDMYALFVQEGIDITRENGKFSYITPTTWLNNSQYEQLRKWLVERAEFQKIADLRDVNVFPEATVLPVIFVCSATSNPNWDKEFDVEHFQSQFETTSFISSVSIWSQYEEFVFNLSLTKKDVPVMNKLGSVSAVGGVADVRFGVKVYQKGKGEPPQTGKEADNDVFRSEAKEGEDYYPYVRGRDVQRWHIDDQDSWIKYGKHLAEPRNLELFSSPRVFIRRIVSERLVVAPSKQTIIADQLLHTVTPKDTTLSIEAIAAVLGSKAISYYFRKRYNRTESTFPEVRVGELESLPAAPSKERVTSSTTNEEVDGSFEDSLKQLVHEVTDSVSTLETLNLSLRDHLGSYSDGPTLADIGLTQPPKGSADSLLQQTTEEKPNLRVGEASVERESPNTVEIRLTARYKPDEDSGTRPRGGSRSGGTGEARGTAYETDQWGYTETDPLPALRITDLTETEADLIEAFVPVAVDEAGGFANFRETATKTNSLVDRLRKLTLPAVDDVREGLESYIETKERAEELEGKIERTDDLIDEIVYELYGLTDEEIEIVEETVGD